ncbi:hypothetical protein OPV22_029863 [Ensete ventricosum]|uniref:Uncharacterized protein n=1 Tax=Ensete ventricosum TaxID=4639 RepID=A0AAV8P6J8_ENSVE|nr:hypothetical protein OPV22_029863 [Ensete ventricosum]
MPRSRVPLALETEVVPFVPPFGAAVAKDTGERQIGHRQFGEEHPHNAKNGVEKLDKARIFMVYLPRIGGLGRHGPGRLRRS